MDQDDAGRVLMAVGHLSMHWDPGNAELAALKPDISNVQSRPSQRHLNQPSKNKSILVYENVAHCSGSALGDGHTLVANTRGSDNSLPLLPQWLQAKLGDTKVGMEHPANSHHSEPASSLKGSGSGKNFHEVEKRKDIYKFLHDSETGYKDHWRDEERETKSAIHRDHRRERWPDNSMWHSGERRNSSRWSDSGNREISFDQRREGKWNTCWGPNDKELQSSKDDDGPHQRIVSRLSGHGRNMVKEGEMHSRSWRSNSSMISGKAQPSYQNPFTPQQIHIPGYGHGNGENGLPLSPSGMATLTPTMLLYQSHALALLGL
ncbi:hypothetical protein KSP40_PGU012833 [Platanthera guangdongensis]|uniref:Uncharacterized protein n=1 Tax=Platanthera guangdongensis TaxID=2320717 RepID=A0ABR2MU89_9ASPA